MAANFRSERVAFVVGNARYEQAKTLPNAENDAIQIAAKLGSLGFDIVGGPTGSQKPGIDLTKGELATRYEEFMDRLQEGGTAVLFFAGHGLQVGDENYIVPTDANLDAPFPLGELVLIKQYVRQAALDAGANGRVIVLLDACREAPFSRERMRRLAQSVGETLGGEETFGLGGVNGGFATMRLETTADMAPTYIAFATAPGAYAYDGPDSDNSPFTEALLSHMGTRGLDIDELMDRVGRDVKQSVSEMKRSQDPWRETNLKEPFHFAPTNLRAAWETAILAGLAGFIVTLGLFDRDNLRTPFVESKWVPEYWWVFLLGVPLALVMSIATMRWGSGRFRDAVHAFLGTWVAYALAIMILSSKLVRLDPKSVQKAMEITDPLIAAFTGAFTVIALLAAWLSWAGSQLANARAVRGGATVSRVLGTINILSPIIVVLSLLGLAYFLRLNDPRTVASAFLWLLAGSTVAAGAALSLKPQGGIFTGFSSTVGALSIGLVGAVLFALAAVRFQSEPAMIVIVGSAWFTLLGAQLGYCFAFYVPDYVPRQYRKQSS